VGLQQPQELPPYQLVAVGAAGDIPASSQPQPQSVFLKLLRLGRLEMLELPAAVMVELEELRHWGPSAQLMGEMAEPGLEQ
jgi:hypothetical protein